MPDIEVNEVPIASEDGEEKQEARKSTEEIRYLEEEDEWVDVLGSGHLKVKTLVKGEPETRPQNFDTVIINLKGELEDGTVVEDCQELEVEVNGSEVIQGLDLVLPLLDVGQKVEAIISPRLAYGATGLPPKIPPQATITYTIELLKVIIPPELTNVPFESRKQKAMFKRTRGNWWYARGDANKAVQCYRAALDSLQDSTPFLDENEKSQEMPDEIFREMVQQRLIVYNNLAAAQLMLDAYDAALMSVENVIKLEPNNVKALFRMGKIHFAKGNTEEAVETFKKVVNLEPDNQAVKKELNLALKRQSKENLQTKNLYQKMFNAVPEKKTEKEKPSSYVPAVGSTRTKVLGALATVTVAIAIGLGLAQKYKLLE